MLIGAHESVAGGVSRAFARAEEHGGQALQIFTKSSRAWGAPLLTAQEQRAFRREAKRTQLPAIAHGSYLANLASEDPLIRERSLTCLADELVRCDRLGVSHLIFHPGSHVDEKRGLRLVAQGLDELHARTKVKRARLCLESTAGQGNCVGWRFEHLAEILSMATTGDRVDVCLDSCHLFAAGYDLSTTRGYRKVMRQLDTVLGAERVACFHLNDSKKPLGARVDRHEEVGKGTMGLTAFRCLVNDPRFTRTVAVLETPVPERYGETIRLLRSLERL